MVYHSMAEFSSLMGALFLYNSTDWAVLLAVKVKVIKVNINALFLIHACFYSIGSYMESCTMTNYNLRLIINGFGHSPLT